jgi:DNA replication protein DnaC
MFKKKLLTLEKVTPKTYEQKIALELKPIKDAPSPAIQDLRKLYSQEYSTHLKDFLSSFDVPRERSLAVFKSGIKKFAQCVNRNYQERQEFYGNTFLGLHYRNDLVRLWNTTYPKTPISFTQLYFLHPKEWDYLFLQNREALVYKGDKPSMALDQLIHGPVILDCGQFCLLSILFGYRYMLGNELFNQLFGKSPLYITPSLYHPIKDLLNPMGNPLYSFFEEVKISEMKTIASSVYLTHVANHSEYFLKHPGGNFDGENCLVMEDGYTIFDPAETKTTHLARGDVKKLLWKAFNEEPDEHDKDKLTLYKAQYEKDPTAVHDLSGIKFDKLINLAELLAHKKIDEQDWKADASQRPQSSLSFNFEKFFAWVKKNEAPFLTVKYNPYAEDKLNIPRELMQKFPYENKYQMSFATFKTDSSLHKRMHEIALTFCAYVMEEKSCCVIISGKAGIGKTATAVCCAKELVSRGKNLLWISEVSLNHWTENANNLDTLFSCRSKIRSMLADEPHVVFLDDNNISGYAGQVLLEEIYSWYVTHPGKGLMMTSNEAVNFKKCYGSQLEGIIPAPFLNYTSEQYENIIILSSLMGNSLRPQPDFKIAELSDEKKIEALLNSYAESSIGIMVSHEAYLASRQAFIQDLEFVPAIDAKLVNSIRYSLLKTNTLGPEYEKLSDAQKKWLKIFEIPERREWRNNEDVFIPHHTGIGARIFEKTKHTYIAVEILSEISHKQVYIDSDCLRQILSLINYAHDHGGKKIIFINRTTFSHSECLEKIKEEIGRSEKERTISRMNCLLFSPYLGSVKKSNENRDILGTILKEPDSTVTFPSLTQSQQKNDFIWGLGVESFCYKDVGVSPLLFSLKPEEIKKVDNHVRVETALMKIFQKTCILLPISETLYEIKFLVKQSFKNLEKYSKILLTLGLEIRLLKPSSLGVVIQAPAKIEILHSLTEISSKLELAPTLNKLIPNTASEF